MSQKDTTVKDLKGLPQEMLIEIFRFSSIEDVFKRLVLICQEFYGIIKSELFFNIYMTNEFEEVSLPIMQGHGFWVDDVKIREHPEVNIYTYKTAANYDPWGFDSDEEEIEVKFSWSKKVVTLKPRIGFFEDIPMMFYYDRTNCYVRYNGLVQRIKSHRTCSFDGFCSKILDYIIKPPTSYGGDNEESKYEKFQNIFRTQKESKLKNITVTIHPSSFMKKTVLEGMPECLSLDQFFLYLGYFLGRTFRPEESFGVLVDGEIFRYGYKRKTIQSIDEIVLFPQLNLEQEHDRAYYEEKNVFIHYYGKEEIIEEKIDLKTTTLQQFDLYLRQKFGLEKNSLIVVSSFRSGRFRRSYHPLCELQLKNFGRRSYREDLEKSKEGGGHPRKICPLACLLREDRAFPLPPYKERKKYEGEDYKDWDTSMEYLYQNLEEYRKSLSDIGFRDGEYIQFFEVTGPSIPVCYCSMVGDPNIIDINPNWSVHQFLRYCGLVSGHGYKYKYIERISYQDRKTMDTKTTLLKDVIDIEEARSKNDSVNVR